MLREQFEGQLYKYTNVVKGWQHRWFVLDPDEGQLFYFLGEAPPDSEQTTRPRGCISLSGASILPSGEDSSSFTIHTADSGERGYQLRANDARQRQEWVARLRAVAEMHAVAVLPDVTAQRGEPGAKLARARRSSSSLEVIDTLYSARDEILHAGDLCNTLSLAVDRLPTDGGITHIDTDLLLLKAAAQATNRCLADCLDMLVREQQGGTSHSHDHLLPSVVVSKTSSVRTAPSRSNKQQQGKFSGNSPSKTSLGQVKKNTSSPDQSVSEHDKIIPVLLRKAEKRTESASNFSAEREGWQLHSLDEDVTDEEDSAKFAGVTPPGDEEKSLLVDLLSQLKLGTDLTKVNLPAFLLERRSLLEVYADAMGAHAPHYFPRIAAAEATPRVRALAVLEWYLTAFHVGRRKGDGAKKPYNPLVGETFLCSWRRPSVCVRYVAEQVSHRPPVTAFYVECPEHRICVSAAVGTKSNYSGLSVGIKMVGDVSLLVGGSDERYEFGLPVVFVKSLTNIPHVELGGRVGMTCLKTGYTASIVFDTPPLYGRRENQVRAELRDGAGARVCTVTGEWDDTLVFVDGIATGAVIRRMDVESLPVCAKRVRKCSAQGRCESRRVWEGVTRALRGGDVKGATKEKKKLEEGQRKAEMERRESGRVVQPRYFHKVGDNWVYNNALVSF